MSEHKKQELEEYQKVYQKCIMKRKNKSYKVLKRDKVILTKMQS